MASTLSHEGRAASARVRIPAWLIWTILVVAATAIGYTAFTGHIREDYLITFRFSRNGARGHGLVHLVGERIDGFTSFLNVMIPAVADWLYGGESIGPTRAAYRTARIAAPTSAAVVLGGLLRTDPSVPRWAAWLLPVAVVADFKTAADARNGQETAFVRLFTALAMWSLRAGRAAGWVGCGLAAAGLMDARPDGFVFAAILGIAGLMLVGMVVLSVHGWRQIALQQRGILATGGHYGTGYLAMDCHSIVFRSTGPPAAGRP